MTDDPNAPQIDPKLQAAADYAGITPDWLGALSQIPLLHGQNMGTMADNVSQQLPPPNPGDYPGIPRQTLAQLASIPLENPDKRGPNFTGTMADTLPANQPGVNTSNFAGTGISPGTVGNMASIPMQHTSGDIGTMADLAPRWTAPRWAPPRTRLIDLLNWARNNGQ